MICLKCVVVVILSLQICSGNVLSAQTLKDDAQDALLLLSEEVNATSKIVTEDTPDSWEKTVNVTNEIIIQDVLTALTNFYVVVDNISEFAIVTNGGDCVRDILNTTTKTSSLKDNEGTSNIFSDLFSNLLSLATVEIKRVNKQFKELDEQFTSNCVEHKINCDGVSSYVIAEVNRLVQGLKRIKIDFLAEVYVLEYKYFVDWKATRAIVETELSEILKNATTCLAAKIEDYTKGTNASTIRSSSIANDSVIDAFYDLLSITEQSYQSGLASIISTTIVILKHTNHDYIDTITDIRGAAFRANQTINLLHNIAPEFNLTHSCALPDLASVINSSVARALEEYTILGPNAVTSSYKEGVEILNDTVNGVLTFPLEIRECNQDTNCDYLLEKIAKKAVEVPEILYNRSNSTSVMLYQSIMSVRESGTRIVRDILEELEVGIASLKTCIRVALY